MRCNLSKFSRELTPGLDINLWRGLGLRLPLLSAPPSAEDAASKGIKEDIPDVIMEIPVAIKGVGMAIGAEALFGGIIPAGEK